MSNPSTYWGQLSLPNPPQGAIPYVAQDNASIITNVTNFQFNDYLTINGFVSTGGASVCLNVNTSGDYTGTNAINTYGQIDSYQTNAGTNIAALPYSAISAGFTCSSSQGTGTVPLASLSGDFIGQFSGWSYNSQLGANNFYPVAAELIYAKGAVIGNVGGELHWATKADGGALIDRLYLDNAGNIQPTTVTVGGVSSANLGAPNKGWGKLNLNYTITAVPGSCSQSTPAGVAQIAAGQKTIVVTNGLVDANSIVIATLQFIDATCTQILTVVPAAGSFTITCNANATANTKIAYVIINTDN